MSIKQQAGYPDKTPASNPPIEVDGYESMGTNNALSDPSRKGFEKQSPVS